ncbi:MAG: larC 1 [Firmicutes bacterium]|nr:larC 1 [Bacillota bacterium]
MQTLYLDCFSGISGNMFLGAMLDLGVSEEWLRLELGKLPLNGYELHISKVIKAGINAIYVDVKIVEHHHHRFLADINKIIDDAPLSAVVKDNSKKVFRRLAEAEAKVHSVDIDSIHFHEVGAVDAIIDIVGAAICLEYLGIERIYVSKLQTGTGFVKCSHGTMPVPAPATAELLKGIPYYTGDIAQELVTPTGAALIAALSQGNGCMPTGFISQRIGYGAGTWELVIPNVLRAMMGEMGYDSADEELLVVEANIDDLNPQIYPYAIEKLMATGAIDVWLTPIVMKKGRPAVTLSVLVSAVVKDKIVSLLLAETTTIGVRCYSVDRVVADRNFVDVETAWGTVRAKVSSYQGRVCNIAPEYEDCRQLAEVTSQPLKVICQDALTKAWSLYGQD